MRQMTSKDILDYAEMRVQRAGAADPFVTIADAWTSAKVEYTQGKPDAMIRLLRESLGREEVAAEPHGEREICSGPVHARADAAERARHITALLWRIAEEYPPERVWGDELVRREVERDFATH